MFADSGNGGLNGLGIFERLDGELNRPRISGIEVVERAVDVVEVAEVRAGFDWRFATGSVKFLATATFLIGKNSHECSLLVAASRLGYRSPRAALV